MELFDAQDEHTLIQPFILDSGNWHRAIKMIFTIFHRKKEVFRGKNYLTFWYLQKGNYLQKGSIII